MAAMIAKYPGTCRQCGGRTREGDKIKWIASGVIEHDICPLVPDIATEARFTFARSLHHEGHWVVRVEDPEDAQRYEGQTVEVSKRNGGSQTTVLGRLLSTATEHDCYYLIVDEQQQEQIKLDIGVYELPTGEVYIVKLTRDKERLYAKRLIEINSTRLTEADGVVQIEFEYEAGAIRRIRPEHKMPLERAKGFCLRYGRCLACNRKLKVASSIEAGLGPVCRKMFRS
jgi:hypothetical protein